MLKMMFISLCLIIALQNTTKAQTLQNTSWKSFFDAPINDTATLSIGSDSATISSSQGMALVVGTIKIINDTIQINDVSGPMKCSPDDKGIYRYAITNGKLVFTFISDNCDGRSKVLGGSQWIKSDK